MEFTTEQLNKILQSKPLGTTNDQIIGDLVKQGVTFKGADMNAVRQRVSSLSEQAATSNKPKERSFDILRGADNQSTRDKVADFTGGKEISQGLGQALAQRGTNKLIDQTQDTQSDIQGQLIAKLREQRESGQDTSRIEAALQGLTGDIQNFGDNAGELLNPNQLTSKQVIGDALQLATLATGGKMGGVVAGKATQATSAIPGLIQGAKVGAITGGVGGGLTGVSQGLQQDKDTAGILRSGGIGVLSGAAAGGILGGLIGGVSGGLKSQALRREVLNQQITAGQKSAPINLTPKQQKTVEIAKQQGISDVDIDFMRSLDSTTKGKAQRMIDLAEEATVNKRALGRPIDVAGESMLERVKDIEIANKAAGKAVNDAAKALRGQAVDANAIADTAQELIDDLGVIKNVDGSFNFNNSVFKNTPALQKKLQKFVQEVPTGQADAYDVHIFKKSIDELVDFGTQGEGLKGNAQRLLKTLRATADNVLDSNFENYNLANTDFKVTKEVLDEARDLFGKKTGFAKEKGGQLLRQVFSNNNQRPRVLTLIENLDNTARQYGGNYQDSLVDQALFTEILEEIYGTQATTSLQGQVSRAVTGTQKALAAIRDPIKGVGELVAAGAEKALGVSPENKRKILKALLSF